MSNKNKREEFLKITKEQHQKAEGQKNAGKDIYRQEQNKQEIYRKENFGKSSKEQHQKMRRESKEDAKKEDRS